MRREYFYLVGIGIILVSVFLLIIFITLVDTEGPIIVNTAVAQNVPSSAELTNRFQEGVVLTFLYPKGWTYAIPRTDFIIVSDPASASQSAGPTLTIERIEPAPNTGVAETLDAYLQRSLLRSGTTWRIISGPSAITIDGREALRVVLEGGQSVGAPELHTEVVATQGDSNTIYIFQQTALASVYPSMVDVFNGMLNSVDIKE